MDSVELIYDYFEDRAHAAALIRQRRPAGLGLFGVLLGSASLFTAHALAGRAWLPFGWPGFALALLWQSATTFVAAAVLHMLLELGGAKGDARALFVHLGLSELAWVAAVPLLLLCQLVWTRPGHGAQLVFFVVGLWSLTLKARGIRDEYGVGGGRAWLTLGAPFLALVLFALLALFLMVLGAVYAALS